MHLTHSCVLANNLHGKPIANTIFDEQCNGINLEWFGNVWLFPPKVANGISSFQYQWLEKAELKWKKREIQSCLVLLEVCFHDTGFRKAMQHPHVFITTPLCFWTPSGKEKDSTGTNYVVVYL